MTDEKYKALIVKTLLGDASQVESEQLAAWRKASPENERLYADFARIWLSAPQAEPSELPDMEKEWKDIETALNFSPKKQSKIHDIKKHPVFSPTRSLFGNRYWAVAALFFIVLLGTFLYQRFRATNMVEVSAAAGQREQTVLPDGSRVQLNSVSSIFFDHGFSGESRVVRLEGEAFFEIEKNGRPFIIVTENARIKVLGTVFNVWARGNETRVIVKEGRVAFKAQKGKTPLVLAANQMAICRNAEISPQPVDIDAAQHLGWLRNKLTFVKTPLAEIVEELQRLYDVKIELSEKAIGLETLTASFDRKDIDDVLDSLCLAMQLRVVHDGEVYRISK